MKTLAVLCYAKYGGWESGNTKKTNLGRLSKSEWVVSMSSHPLSTAEYNILQKSLNYNTDNVNQLEFLAALEAAFKAIRLGTETQGNMR